MPQRQAVNIPWSGEACSRAAGLSVSGPVMSGWYWSARKDLPANVVAVGDPARVIREI